MQVKSIQLIGSRARGDARPDSDWDFLVYSDWTTDGQFFNELAFPGRLPMEVVAEIRRQVPAGAPVDIFLQYTWDGKPNHAVQYSADGQLVWDYGHDCAGGWLDWKGDTFSNEKRK